MANENFVMPEGIKKNAKALPVILMLDVSGSMAGPPIQILNNSVRKMLESFSKDKSASAEIQVSIVTFGGNAELKLPLTNAATVSLTTDMVASGGTPLGSAISIVSKMVEDRDIIPSSAYRPAIVLVSDGVPTDNWETKFDEFLKGARTSKCHRMALGINVTEGDEAHEMLSDFVSEGENVFLGDADKIVRFFKYVAMSVGTRTKSNNANLIPLIQDLDL
jgi:uncharacterized protein YegL